MKEKIKLDLQLFAEEPDPAPEVDSLLADLTDPKPENEQEENEEPEVKQETKIENEQEEKEESEVEKEAKPEGVKGLRKSYEEEKRKAKELEEARIQLEKDSKAKTEKLIKAIKLGIKGDTEEEILMNLDEYEIKEKAAAAGLTEEQIRKDAELKTQMETLSREKQEVLFNRRALDLQQKQGLTNDQIVEFVQECGNLGIDLLTNPTEFEAIYNRLYNSETQTVLKSKEEEIASLKAEIKELKASRGPTQTVKGNPEEKDSVDPKFERLLKELT